MLLPADRVHTKGDPMHDRSQVRSSSLDGASLGFVALLVMIGAIVAPAPSFAAFSCNATPMSGCLQASAPHPTGLWMNVRGASHRRDNAVWKWFRGVSPTPATFADPTTTSDYAFCLYGQQGNQMPLIFSAIAPAASQCKGRSCWRKTGTGYRYRTGTGLPNGLTKIYLDARSEGRARIVLKARGTNLHLPDLPMPLPLRVQLQAENGPCWEGTYVDGGVSQNSQQHFRGRAVEP